MDNKSKLKICFIGLGVMGSRISKNIARNNFDIALYDISPSTRKEFREQGYYAPEESSDAARDADIVTTDVWTSMGFESEKKERIKDFADWQVDKDMIKLANKDALFMHCLPAHRGEEVTAGVIDGPQSIVWEEAENRLHVQKALLEYLLIGNK